MLALHSYRVDLLQVRGACLFLFLFLQLQLASCTLIEPGSERLIRRNSRGIVAELRRRFYWLLLLHAIIGGMQTFQSFAFHFSIVAVIVQKSEGALRRAVLRGLVIAGSEHQSSVPISRLDI